jgi:hypothetical protein
VGIETQNVNCKTLGIGANRFSLLRQMRHGILGIAPSHLVKRVQLLQVKYLLFKEIIFLPSYHKKVTQDCSVHKLKIICRISDLVFNFLLLLGPPIAVAVA